ncbi:MAG TPA: hypothetical protein VHR47_10615 [Bacillota bacterium]|nr:hypothetical protein [Bacillota bacterium]
MKHLKIFGFVLLFVILFNSTLLEAKTRKEDTLEAENDALVFGCIDTSEAKYSLISVDFFKYPPLENKLKYFNIDREIHLYGVYNNGLFIADRVKPGPYWLLKLLLCNWRGYVECPFTYEPTPADTITIHENEIHYFGSYKFTVIKGKTVFSGKKFSFDQTGIPTEKELLEQVYEKMKGTRWEEKIKERLSQL